MQQSVVYFLPLRLGRFISRSMLELFAVVLQHCLPLLCELIQLCLARHAARIGKGYSHFGYLLDADWLLS